MFDPATIVDRHGRPYPRAAYGGGFEGAAAGDRMADWGLSALGPNAAVEGSLASLRNRQAELVRNNPLAGGGVDTIVANMVGRGIRPLWNIADRDLLNRVQDAWFDSVQEADADAAASFYGLQAIVAGAMCNTGEAFGVFSYPSPYDGLATPLQVRVFEGAQVIELRPGNFPKLPAGWDVAFAYPTDVGGNYVAWMIQQLRDVAKGMGITYEQLTGDLAGVTYTSIRAGLLDFRNGQRHERPTGRVSHRHLPLLRRPHPGQDLPVRPVPHCFRHGTGRLAQDRRCQGKSPAAGPARFAATKITNFTRPGPRY